MMDTDDLDRIWGIRLAGAPAGPWPRRCGESCRVYMCSKRCARSKNHQGECACKYHRRAKNEDVGKMRVSMRTGPVEAVDQEGGVILSGQHISSEAEGRTHGGDEGPVVGHAFTQREESCWSTPVQMSMHAGNPGGAVPETCPALARRSEELVHRGVLHSLEDPGGAPSVGTALHYGGETRPLLPVASTRASSSVDLTS